MRSRFFNYLCTFSVAVLIAFQGTLASAQTTAETLPIESNKIVHLEPFEIEVDDAADTYDDTGMGSFEQEMSDELFSNDLVSADDFLSDDFDIDMDTELSAIAEPSSAERIAGEGRLKLRGFPTPELRNGFIQIGIPETLNTSQTIIIQGPLVPVLGRAAPGGIRNAITVRPRVKSRTRIDTRVSNLDQFRFGYETSGPLVPKKLWQRVALNWQRRDGPEEFSREETILLSTALTWRQSRTASTMLSFDYRETNAHASPGIPEYRETADGKIKGAYLPLAYFNANGPNAEIVRRSTILGLQFDTAPTPGFALRANVETWLRTVEQDRFTNSQLNLDTRVFSGTREPRFLSQPQEAVAVQLEGILRFQKFGAAHKLLASLNRTNGEYRREERALSIDDRNALPLDVRRFSPDAPNYDRPAYSPELYQRVLTDRQEEGNYTSAELSDRIAFQKGRLVVTSGLRYDRVDQHVEDHRPANTTPPTADHTTQISYHTGVNYQLFPSRLLLFASTSTAFDPSTPVDSRTGHIQDNETTSGYETGFKGRGFDKRFDYSASAVLLFNHHISRRNPLYNDPIADANQTQPQLVASGEERFTGARWETKWKIKPTVSFQVKGSYIRAITTSSPDLPHEIGRPGARRPAINLNTSLRGHPPSGQRGTTWGLGWQYISGYVSNYEDSRREELSYPGYGLVSLNTGYQWQLGRNQLSFDAGLRNAFSRDLLASNSRIDPRRELTVAAKVVF